MVMWQMYKKTAEANATAVYLSLWDQYSNTPYSLWMVR